MPTGTTGEHKVPDAGGACGKGWLCLSLREVARVLNLGNWTGAVGFQIWVLFSFVETFREALKSVMQ